MKISINIDLERINRYDNYHILKLEELEEAKKCIERSLDKVKKDVEPPEDIIVLSTGISSLERRKIFVMRDILKDLEKRFGRGIPIEEITEEAREKLINETQVQELLKKMSRQGEVFEPQTGFFALM